MSLSMIAAGAGAASGAGYLFFKEDPSPTEKAVASCVIVVSLGYLALNALSLGSRDIQPLPIQDFDGGMRPNLDNLGSHWEMGDFVVGSAYEYAGQVEVVNARLGVVQVFQAGVEADRKLTLEGWMFIFEGGQAAQLKQQLGNWRELDLLRPLDRVGDVMTFKHLPSQEVFTATVAPLPDTFMVVQ